MLSYCLLSLRVYLGHNPLGRAFFKVTSKLAKILHPLAWRDCAKGHLGNRAHRFDEHLGFSVL
jgi:hypothetical protein